MVQLICIPCPVVDGFFFNTMGSTLSVDDEERPDAHCTQACYTQSSLSVLFLETISRRENMNETKNMYSDEIQITWLKYVSKFRLKTELNINNLDFDGISIGFTMQIKFPQSFMIVPVISAPKYVGTYNLEEIGGKCFPKLHHLF